MTKMAKMVKVYKPFTQDIHDRQQKKKPKTKTKTKKDYYR